MKYTLLFVLMLCSGWASAQITFQKTYGVDTSDEEGKVVIQAADSGYFVSGHRLNDTGYIGMGMLMRTDKFGNELWTQYYSFSPASHLWIVDMSATSDGNLIVTGQIYYNVTNFDMFLAKLDTAGNVLWQKSYGGAGRQNGHGVKEALDGGFIVCGNNDTAIGENMVYLLKTNSQGDSLWSKMYANEAEQYGQAIGLTNDSGFVMVGSAKAPTDLAGKPYVIRTDKNGDTLWTRIITDLQIGQAVDVHIKANTDIVITGSSNALSWGPKPMLAQLDDAGNLDWFEIYFNGRTGNASGFCATNDNGFIISGNDSFGNFYIIKTDSIGDQQWFKSIDESALDWGSRIQQTSDGGYVFTGTTATPGPGNITPLNTILIKLDGNGNLSSKMTFAKGGSALSVYPNPGNDIVYISNKTNEKIQAIELYDLAGKLVRSYDANKASISVSGISKGVYMLKLVTGQGIVTNKLVIE
jgi:hypothetical protein